MDNAEIKALFRRFAEQQVALTENLNRFQREFTEGQKRLQDEQNRLANEQTRLANEQTRLAEAQTRFEEAMTRRDQARLYRVVEEPPVWAEASARREEAGRRTQRSLDALIALVNSRKTLPGSL